jgi:predicted dehydrogenase
VAIVGCGVIGVNHAHAIARQQHLRITALIDPMVEARTALAALVADELGVSGVEQFDDLEAAEQAGAHVDLVVIATPSGLHVRLAEAALAAGSHVVIEKPLDVSMPRAREIARLAEAAESRGLVVSVISQHRFDPASVVVAKAAHDGSLGRLTSGLASVPWWRTQEYYDSGQWRGTWALDGGGAVMNQGVHTVDLLVWFLGEPVEVSAQTSLVAHENVEIEDIAVATVRFASGALAVIHATTAAYPGLEVRLQVHGDRGSAAIESDRLAYLYTDGVKDDAAGEAVDAGELLGAPKGPDYFVGGHLRQYDDIVDAIQSSRAPGVTVQDALLSLAVVRSIYLSATLGRTIAVSEVLDGSLDDVVVVTGTGAVTANAAAAAATAAAAEGELR